MAAPRPAGAPQAPSLPRQVMRRAAAVALAGVLAVSLWSLWRMAADVHEEAQAAAALGQVMQRVAALPQMSDAEALQALDGLKDEPALRHVRLQVRASDRRLLFEIPATAEADGIDALAQALLRWLPATVAPARPEGAPVATWLVLRPQGGPWRVTWQISHASERREALINLGPSMGLWLLTLAALLAALRWQLQRAFAPLQRLLAAIRGIEEGQTDAVRRLPPMPSGELQAVSAALAHLAGALERAEAERRTLAARVQSVQEDERRHLAQELHDEMGQRLTALRVDAVWLARRLGEPAASGSAAATATDSAIANANANANASASAQAELQVVQGMVDQCVALQADVRGLLLRLRPLAAASAGPTAGLIEVDAVPLTDLARLLRELLQAWQLPQRAQALQLQSELLWRPAEDAPAQPWPTNAYPAPALPRALAFSLHRLAQEALTNVARHAQAAHARLGVELTGRPQPGAALGLRWWVEDDGLGLPPGAEARGSGFAGMRHRVWTLGGDWRQGPACEAFLAQALGGAAATHPPGPGTRIEARFDTCWAAAGAPSAKVMASGLPIPSEGHEDDRDAGHAGNGLPAPADAGDRVPSPAEAQNASRRPA